MSIKLYKDGRIVTKVNGIPTTFLQSDDGYTELYAIATPVPTVLEVLPSTEDIASQLRTERDERITTCDWIILRHRDELDEGDGTTLTAESYAAWLAYRKALRDMPSADGFPWDGGAEETPWPVEPE